MSGAHSSNLFVINDTVTWDVIYNDTLYVEDIYPADPVITAKKYLNIDLIFNGKIYKSPVGYEVEIGHSVVRKNKEVGFLEDFCEFNKIKDPLALRGLKRLREIGILIGEVIATISNIIGPEKIFVGGKMAVLGDDLLNPIKESFDKFSFGERTNRYIPIEVSGIDEDAISIGAAIYVIRKYIIRKIANEIS